MLATVCRKDKWSVETEPWIVRQAVFPVVEETVDFGAVEGVYGTVFMLVAAAKLAQNIL